MIDTNVGLFQWPFRRLEGDSPADLVAQLRKKGVTQAWAGSYEGMVYRDVGGVNTRLAAACRVHGPGFLVPFGTVDPNQPDWKEDLRRCHEVHKMPGIRLYPNYHGYALNNPVAVELLSLVAARKMLLQIALCMEDPRTQYPMMPVPGVDPRPLIEVLKGLSDLRVLLLNGGGPTAYIHEMGQVNNLYFDIAMIEGIGGVRRLVADASPSRVVFGSNYPFFYFESALLKIREANFSAEERHTLLEGNAQTLLSSIR